MRPLFQGIPSLAKLVGIAPLNYDSGRMRGQRHIWGGRAHVRTVLYMATVTAVCWNPVIKAYYEKLTKPIHEDGPNLDHERCELSAQFLLVI